MRFRNAALAALTGFALVACQSTGGMTDTRTKKGAILGTLAGAAAGAAIGGHEHRTEGILVGAAAGALTGGLIGRYLDNQAAELDAIPGAEIEKRDDSILVNFQSSLLFDSGSANLNPGAYDRLRSLARTLNNYPKSQVIIKGHTDSSGAESFNQSLSEQRADRVRNFLISEGVAPARITALGFGESLPVATNATESGRAQNRRVELEIRPNEDVMRGGG